MVVITVANDQLRGKNEIEKASVIQWMDFTDGIILPPATKFLFHLLGIMPYNNKVRYMVCELFCYSIYFSL